VTGVRWRLCVQVAEFLGTVHHSYVYTIQEGLDAVRPWSAWVLG
jgi:asparagine synthetase B (glutamine-hydrolysing)